MVGTAIVESKKPVPVWKGFPLHSAGCFALAALALGNGTFTEENPRTETRSLLFYLRPHAIIAMLRYVHLIVSLVNFDCIFLISVIQQFASLLSPRKSVQENVPEQMKFWPSIIKLMSSLCGIWLVWAEVILGPTWVFGRRLDLGRGLCGPFLFSHMCNGVNSSTQ